MFQTSSLWRAAEPFFKKPTTSFTIADLKHETGLRYPALKPKLDEVTVQGIIGFFEHKKTARPYYTYYAVQGAFFKNWKRISNLLALQPAAHYQRETYNPDVVVLFGSCARTEDTEAATLS